MHYSVSKYHLIYDMLWVHVLWYIVRSDDLCICTFHCQTRSLTGHNMHSPSLGLKSCIKQLKNLSSIFNILQKAILSGMSLDLNLFLTLKDCTSRYACRSSERLVSILRILVGLKGTSHPMKILPARFSEA